MNKNEQKRKKQMIRYLNDMKRALILCEELTTDNVLFFEAYDVFVADVSDIEHEEKINECEGESIACENEDSRNDIFEIHTHQIDMLVKWKEQDDKEICPECGKRSLIDTMPLYDEKELICESCGLIIPIDNEVN